ncbi:MAG: response regulator [Candidatus Nanopelagicales bacterium]
MTPEPVRVAIVDDHELVREGLSALMSRAESVPAPHVVYAGESLAQALACGPNVLLLDVVLPGHPASLAERVRLARSQDVGVLLLSATATSDVILEGMRAGALGFVSKGASLDELLAAVDHVSRGEVHLTIDLAVVMASDVQRPSLSAQELLCLRLYASGLKIAAIAHRMEVSPHTVKEYLDRVRAKYAAAGREARTRTELYAAARDDGLLPGS